jgi:hypothetical protein
MKKVILIEDRYKRQIDFIKKTAIDLNKISILENVCGKEKFDYFKELISSNNLTKFDIFDTIIIHRSSISTSEKSRLIDYSIKNSKTLILFSGGISNVTLQNLKNGKLLTINAKDFYSNSLVQYLESNNLNILILAFGLNWEINVKVNFLDKLNFFLIDYKPKPLQIIISDLEVNEYIDEQYFKNKEGLIHLKDLEEIKNSLLMSLSKSL